MQGIVSEDFCMEVFYFLLIFHDCVVGLPGNPFTDQPSPLPPTSTSPPPPPPLLTQQQPPPPQPPPQQQQQHISHPHPPHPSHT